MIPKDLPKAPRPRRRPLNPIVVIFATLIAMAAIVIGAQSVSHGPTPVPTASAPSPPADKVTPHPTGAVTVVDQAYANEAADALAKYFVTQGPDVAVDFLYDLDAGTTCTWYGFLAFDYKDLAKAKVRAAARAYAATQDNVDFLAFGRYKDTWIGIRAEYCG